VWLHYDQRELRRCSLLLVGVEGLKPLVDGVQQFTTSRACKRT
jgi:hypothetical protein